jgi:hypothetical protein
MAKPVNLLAGKKSRPFLFICEASEIDMAVTLETPHVENSQKIH